MSEHFVKALDYIRLNFAQSHLVGDLEDVAQSLGALAIEPTDSQAQFVHGLDDLINLLGQDEAEVLKALRTNTAYLQSEVARRVNTKYAARLKFLPDESFDEGSRVDSLLRDPKVARDLGESEG